jgi:hypothetical protein
MGKVKGKLFDAKINSRAHTCNHSNNSSNQTIQSIKQALHHSSILILNAYGEF